MKLSLVQFAQLMSSAPSAATAWSPTDKHANIAVSSANRLAAKLSGTGSAWRAIRSEVSRSSGKAYVELVNTNSVGSGGALMVGLATSALSLTAYPGSSTTSFGYHANSSGGDVYTNGNASLAGATVAEGSYARIAVDFDAGKLWLGNASVWKGAGDPAGGTDPTFTFTPNLALFVCLGIFEPLQSCMGRFVAADLVGTIPSGFAAWQ